MEEVNLESIMGIIMNSGEAKAKAMEAISLAKQSEFVLAESKIEEATQSLVAAHNSQTSLLSSEANGKEVELSLLMIHSQDHLMTSITFVDLAKEIIALYRKK